MYLSAYMKIIYATSFSAPGFCYDSALEVRNGKHYLSILIALKKKKIWI